MKLTEVIFLPLCVCACLSIKKTQTVHLTKLAVNNYHHNMSLEFAFKHMFSAYTIIANQQIGPHVNWAVSLVSLIFLRGLCGYVRVNAFTLSPARACCFKYMHSNMPTTILTGTCSFTCIYLPFTCHLLAFTCCLLAFTCVYLHLLAIYLHLLAAYLHLLAVYLHLCAVYLHLLTVYLHLLAFTCGSKHCNSVL